jgi:hypothetical protein
LVCVGAKVAVGCTVDVGGTLVFVAEGTGGTVALGAITVGVAVKVNVGSAMPEGKPDHNAHTPTAIAINRTTKTRPNIANHLGCFPVDVLPSIDVGVLTTLERKVSLTVIAAKNSPAVLNLSCGALAKAL